MFSKVKKLVKSAFIIVSKHLNQSTMYKRISMAQVSKKLDSLAKCMPDLLDARNTTNQTKFTNKGTGVFTNSVQPDLLWDLPKQTYENVSPEIENLFPQLVSPQKSHISFSSYIGKIATSQCAAVSVVSPIPVNSTGTDSCYTPKLSAVLSTDTCTQHQAGTSTSVASSMHMLTDNCGTDEVGQLIDQFHPPVDSSTKPLLREVVPESPISIATKPVHSSDSIFSSPQLTDVTTLISSPLPPPSASTEALFSRPSQYQLMDSSILPNPLKATSQPETVEKLPVPRPEVDVNQSSQVPWF